MKQRTLLNGKKTKEQPKEITWQMGSLCPQKYLIVDCETGDLWVKARQGWGHPSADLIASAKKAIRLHERQEKENAEWLLNPLEA